MGWQREDDRGKLVTRRAAILGGAKLAMLSALTGRLYYLQIVQGDRYVTLAEENRINLHLLAPPRGLITDRAGEPLAVNRQTYKVMLTAEQAQDVESTLAVLSRILPITDKERARILREVRRRRAFVPIPVRDDLSWEDLSRIEVNAPDLPGISIEVGQSRLYPYGETTAHILGYVAPVSKNDDGDDPLLELPDFRVGRDGVEKMYDAPLRGRAGNRQVEVNALGRVIRELARREGTPGAELALTIDLGLQSATMRRLAEEESAAAVILDAQNGEVIALGSSPAYDNNLFARGVSGTQWSRLVSDPRSPLTNKAIAGLYAPGSTYKLVVALAALANDIDPLETHFCNGRLALGDREFHCWKKGGHGRMNMHEGLKQSCDVYFYQVGLKLGVDRISEMAEKLGLGSKLGIDLPGERPGLIPTRGWKQAQLGQPWQKGETLVAAIGQGFVLTSPLQLAVMTARIANGGRAIEPRMLRKITAADGGRDAVHEAFPEIGIPAEHLEIVAAAMNDVVNHRRGTAYRARIEAPEMAMAGKTGTSQVRRISKAERLAGVVKNEDLPWERRDHAIFVAFAPVAAPRFAISVVVEHGGGGSKAAAPIARDLLIATQERFAPGDRQVTAKVEG
jgi:penicillin-binding protein 2